MNQHIKYTKKELKNLIGAKYNPRKLSNKQYKDLKNSIDKFGLVDPIIINSDNTVIGGHQRLKILKEKHSSNYLVNVVQLNLTKEDEKELNVRLNKNNGEFDFDLLANNFDIDELVDWGFKHIELGLNLDKIEEVETSGYIITIKEQDLYKATKLYDKLKDEGYDIKIK
mgnify:CR=1 FL=1|jgi:ParB-like chromosome segregation protein Spo0J